MPEGDTIWQTAQTLRGVFAGRTVLAARSTLPELAVALRQMRIEGQTVTDVLAQGKHLKIIFSGGPILHTHLGMHGSWHVYRPDSRWRRPEWSARFVMETAEAIAVCFQAPVVELLSPAGTAAHPSLGRLGPDLLSADFSAEEALRRIRDRNDQEVGAALMDQTVVAGIGNVYKSEILFLSGVNPFVKVRDLDDTTLAGILDIGKRQMRRNLRPGARRLRSDLSDERMWVYGRAGQRCARCGSTILRRKQGEQARTTYWCPACQQP
jgi:endonuclease VIII